jgi:hypothetical protein
VSVKRVLRIIGKVMLAAAGVVLALTLVETVLRVADLPAQVQAPARCAATGAGYVAAYDHANLHQYYPPNSEFRICTTDFDVPYRIDELGYLGLAGGPPSGRDLLVFGDSFAFGFGVPPADAFAHRLGAYNAGLFGASYPSHAKAFARLAPLLQPKRAIWTIYPPHLISVTPLLWQTRTRFDEQADPWAFWFVGVWNQLRLSKVLLMNTGIGANTSDGYTLEWGLYDPADSRLGLDLAYEEFRKAAAAVISTANASGIDLRVVYVPSKKMLDLEIDHNRPRLVRPGATLDPGLAIRRLRAILEAEGLPAGKQVSAVSGFAASRNWRQLYFPIDAHWNAEGHAAVAEMLRATIDWSK